MSIDYNRQYVGARYVPKFFENPNGSWDWAAGFQYEPLTMVQYGNNTYTSKKLVPATVGSPNLNSDYWANTGDYNGAINNLQNQIDDLKGNYFMPVSNWNVLIIGDSYTVAQNVTTWAQLFKSKVESYGGKVDITGENGGGVVGTGTTGKNFKAVLQSTSGNYNIVIVQGFVNDWVYSESSFTSSLATLDNNIHLKYPKAKVFYMNVSKRIGTDTNDLLLPDFWNRLPSISHLDIPACARSFIYSKEFLDNTSHPTQNGCNLIFQLIWNYILTGNPSLYYSGFDKTFGYLTISNESTFWRPYINISGTVSNKRLDIEINDEVSNFLWLRNSISYTSYAYLILNNTRYSATMQLSWGLNSFNRLIYYINEDIADGTYTGNAYGEIVIPTYYNIG